MFGQAMKYINNSYFVSKSLDFRRAKIAGLSRYT